MSTFEITNATKAELTAEYSRLDLAMMADDYRAAARKVGGVMRVTFLEAAANCYAAVGALRLAHDCWGESEPADEPAE